MMPEVTDRRARAAAHHALADPTRLTIVDALVVGDATPGELRALVNADWNLLAFHLRILERAGVVRRTVSAGDRRRRYVRLCETTIDSLRPVAAPIEARDVLFVCTHNAARSQFAAAAWHAATGQPPRSAGTCPAARVDPLAVDVARDYGIDVSTNVPQGYGAIDAPVGLVISVCDRAREAALPVAVSTLHWSVPDPVGGRRGDFERAFADIAARVARLARSAA